MRLKNKLWKTVGTEYTMKTLSIHIKTPSLGSEAAILPKVNIGTFLQKSSISPQNFPSGYSSLTSSPKASFRDFQLGKAEKKVISLSQIFSGSPKATIKLPDRLDSSRKVPTEDTFSFSGTGSPLASNPTSSRRGVLGQSKKASSSSFKSMTKEIHQKLELQIAQAYEVEEEEETKRPENQNENILNTRLRKKRDELMNDIDKKEKVIQIYQQLIGFCKNSGTQQKNRKMIEGSDHLSRESMKLPVQASIKVVQANSMGKTTKISGRTMSLGSNPSLGAIIQKSGQDRSFFEKTGSKSSLQEEEFPVNHEEMIQKLTKCYSAQVIKKNHEKAISINPQFRVKAVNLDLKDKRFERKKQNLSSSIDRKNEKVTSMLRNSGLLSTDDSPLVSHDFGFPAPTSTGTRNLKEKNFKNIGERIDAVLAFYENENDKLINNIKILEEKIKELQIQKGKQV